MIARRRFRQTVLVVCRCVILRLSSNILVRTFNVTVVVPRLVILVLTMIMPLVRIFGALLSRILWLLPVPSRVRVLIRGVSWLVILDTGVSSGSAWLGSLMALQVTEAASSLSSVRV